MHWLRVYVSVFIQSWDKDYNNPKINTLISRVESRIIWKIESSPKDIKLAFLLFSFLNTLFVLIKHGRVNQLDYSVMLNVVYSAKLSKFNTIANFVSSLEKLAALYLVDEFERLPP